jgi:c-di-GMP-binding flagellar brake protein YcgR
MPFVLLKASDVVVGKPLNWALVDANHRPVMPKGSVVRSAEDLDALVSHGILREIRPQETQDGETTELTFEEIRLQIGDALQLQWQGDSAIRYLVKLVGALKNKSVLVTSPVEDGRQVLLKDGQAFVVRAFCGKHAFAFKTEVLRSYGAPFPYVHLSYPATVRGLVVRKHSRLDVTIIVAVMNSRNVQGAGTVINLSLGGARIHARRPLGEKGERVTLTMKIRMDNLESVITVPAILRAVAPDSEVAGMIAHGVEFVDVEQQVQLVLSAYVYRRLLEDSSDV